MADWLEIAEFLCDTGLAGHALLAELRERFPQSRRDDVYRAIAFAWSFQQAGWLADAMELDGLRGQVGERAGRS